MVAVTSGSDARRRDEREVQRFGTVIVVGGGCYGSYYLRQLRRAELAGAAVWKRLIVVDRDSTCAVIRRGDRTEQPEFRLEAATWEEFFARYLDAAAQEPERSLHDAIV